MNTCSCIITLTLACVGFLPQIRGEACNVQLDDDFHFDCEGTGAFCCDYRLGIYWQCCYTLLGVWYFWFSLVCGLFLLSALVALICGLCRKNRTRNNTARQGRRNVVVFSTNQTGAMSDVEHSVKTKLEDAPPSYSAVYAQPYPPNAHVDYAYPQPAALPNDQGSETVPTTSSIFPVASSPPVYDNLTLTVESSPAAGNHDEGK